ncbi:MAG: hypothetical protein ABJM11_07670 [Marinobacter sp.]|uniref:hypothetical protein n=1 Tax=Marinobacter sp. TaxID=50741 RepID=UPI00329725F5
MAIWIPGECQPTPTPPRPTKGRWRKLLDERRHSERDRRARLLYLTNAGERFMSDLDERANVLRDEMLKGLEDEDLEVALRVFEQVMEDATRR